VGADEAGPAGDEDPHPALGAAATSAGDIVH
jgi:hypothetical protein